MASRAEKHSSVRLIIQRPGDGAALLRRYESDLEADGRYFCGVDPKLPAHARRGTMPVVDNYWSFKGLSRVRLLGGETQLSEPIRRLAHQQLGIEINHLSLVTVVASVVRPSVPERFYVHTRDWTGTINAWCNPETIHGPGGPGNGDHEWVDPKFLSCYLYHPEVKAAVAMCVKSPHCNFAGRNDAT